MQAPPDQTHIRLPLPGYAKWAVRVWLALLLLSPLLVFLTLSLLQVLALCAVLGGFLLPFLLGRLPGELEAASEMILLYPRAQRYAWMYLLGRNNPITDPRPRSFPVAETSLRWEERRLFLNTGGGSVLLGYGAQMEPVMDWLVRRGVRLGGQ